MSAFEEKPILQGVLWKRAQKSGSNWKKRYFKLFATRLTYSVKENGKERGRMNFTEEFFVQDGAAPKGKFGFLVTDFVTSHHLATDTKDQKDFWCHAIATVIRKQLELAKYFEEVRKSVKVVDQDLAEKQYQARLDNYYKTVGRPIEKQNRKSVVDFRAAQVLAEAADAAQKSNEATEVTEKTRLKAESERLAREAEILREVAEKDEQPESLTVGAEPILEGEEDGADSDDEAPDLPPLPPPPPPPPEGFDDAPTETPHVAHVEQPKTPKNAAPPVMPPRKNTIQPAQAAEVLTASHSNAPSRRPTLNATTSSDALMVAAAPSWIQEPAVNVPVENTRSPPPSAASSPRGTEVGKKIGVAVSEPERKTSVAPAAPRPSVVALAQSISTGSSGASQPPSRKNTVTAEPSSGPQPASRKNTVTAEPSHEIAPARKLTVTVDSSGSKPPMTTPTSSHAQTSSISQSTSPPLPSPTASAPKTSMSSPSASAVASEPPKQATSAPAKVGGGLAGKLGMWQNKVDSHLDKQANNVFSGSYQGTKGQISKDQYGKAPEGSKTEERAKAAADWVEQEIEKLIKVILEMGTFDPQEGGIKTVQFGPLFYKYADISDTLVGILMRAKKRKRIMYQGDMLFQNMHDHVKITVLQA